jgi:hypothetical protein
LNIKRGKASWRALTLNGFKSACKRQTHNHRENVLIRFVDLPNTIFILFISYLFPPTNASCSKPLNIITFIQITLKEKEEEMYFSFLSANINYFLAMILEEGFDEFR